MPLLKVLVGPLEVFFSWYPSYKFLFLIDSSYSNRKKLNLEGSELISIKGIKEGLKPGDKVSVELKYKKGDTKKIEMLCRIDTNNELEYFKHGGILQYVLRNMI